MMLRPAEDGDIPAVAALMNRAFRGLGTAVGWNSEAAYIDGERTSPALLRQELRDHHRAILLVADDSTGSIIGSVMLVPLDESVWQLGSLAIEPLIQNGGTGRALLAAAEMRSKSAGAEAIRMKVVNVRDTVIAWYMRRGYLPTGAVEPFPYGDDRFGTPRRPDLNFVVLEKRL